MLHHPPEKQSALRCPGSQDDSAICVGPRNWEKAFGYAGDARWLAVWWTPAGDEAVYDDGLVFADGNWPFFLDLVDLRIALPLLRALGGHPRGRYALGSSDKEATHCPLLDLEPRQVFVAPLRDGVDFVRSRRREARPQMPALSGEEWARLMEAVAQVMTSVAFSVCTAAGTHGSNGEIPGQEQREW